MPRSARALQSDLTELQAALRQAGERGGEIAIAVRRLIADAEACAFHAATPGSRPMMLAILGGTGVGKSTIVNRLLDATVSAASFRRTFTAGAVAVVKDASTMPPKWLSVPHRVIDSSALPVRGELDSLVVATLDRPLLSRVTFVDTPDVDGDQPAHPLQAERAFRWADAVLFLVTPEKYQMPELLPYYRLARRYAMSALYVMNKCEDASAPGDYAAQVSRRTDSEAAPQAIFTIPRDDAAWDAPPKQNLDALREAIGRLSPPSDEERAAAVGHRVTDLIGRVEDQAVAPLRRQRAAVDRLVNRLRAIESPSPTLDSSPLVIELQRRLQERSILYLIGPGRVVDRVRQVPQLLARLPRSVWDLVRGETPPSGNTPPPAAMDGPIDFPRLLSDEFKVLHSKIDDILRADVEIAPLLSDASRNYGASKLAPERANAIGTEEIADLRQWMQDRWNATPRDTAVLNRILKFVPGGQKLTQWSEAAPYVLAVVVATHHFVFGPVDLAILGAYAAATWMTERVSNEVKAKARRTNSRMTERFLKLAHEQIESTVAWLSTLAPEAATIERLSRASQRLAEHVE